MAEIESAIEKILADEHEVLNGKEQSQPIFDFETDYGAVESGHSTAVDHWKTLGDSDRKKYSKGLPEFLEAHGVENPKDAKYYRAKNLHILRK